MAEAPNSRKNQQANAQSGVSTPSTAMSGGGVRVSYSTMLAKGRSSSTKSLSSATDATVSAPMPSMKIERRMTEGRAEKAMAIAVTRADNIHASSRPIRSTARSTPPPK